MESLKAEQFTDFFHAVHGFEPFVWQRRLATEVIAGRFHEVIRVPTGCGKTSALDVSVFELALQAERKPRERTAARRICFIVDRRLVVDEVTEHALKIRNAVIEAVRGKRDEPILKAVAERLAHLALDPSEPLRVIRLRGGVYRDDGWSADPLTPSIIISTVDQIGSRLLFRGYGVGRRSRPLQAGLLAFDTRIILDEAHLSSVFAETLERVRQFQGWAEESPLEPVRCVAVVRMSATTVDSGRTFELKKEERKDKGLASRLEARKLADLIEVQVQPITKQIREKQPRKAREQEHENREKMVQEFVRHAKTLVGVTQGDGDENPPRVIGVVVNRVATARQVFERLRKAAQGEPEHDATLLTGRIRPYDRDRLLEQWLPKMKAGRGSVPDRPLFVVATQTVEVGANIDFDALVTEAAPLDALRQRFGRLDRLGKRHEQRAAAPAYILIRSDYTSKSDGDPIYGSAIAETWKWLTREDIACSTGKGNTKAIRVDFGVNSLDPKLPTEGLQGMVAPRRETPTLFPAHLDAWVQTDPTPVPDPDVAPFLHGAADTPADVQIVWRADLDPKSELAWAKIVSLMPPRTREALPVPIYEARAWLSGQAEANIADVEGAGVDATRDDGKHDRRALRWRGAGDTAIIDPDDIRSGDTIIVPASYGGTDEFGWNPTSGGTAEDVAEPSLAETVASYPAGAFRRPKLRLRLHPDLLPRPDPATYSRIYWLLDASVSAVEADGQDPWPSIRTLLSRLGGCLPTPQHRAVAEAFLDANKGVRIDLYPDSSGIVLSGPISVNVEEKSSAPDVEYEEPEDDEASYRPGGREVLLSEHSSSVGTSASQFGRECGLTNDVVEVLGVAGCWHDQGKRDRRFQAWLHGSELRALVSLSGGHPLAKSGRDLAQWQSSEAFGYPRGSRHEFVSVRLFEHAAMESGERGDLAKFLIGTHHGHGRSFPPVLSDPKPIEVSLERDGILITATSDHKLYRLDSGWVDLFWRMVRRYGWWGIAYLEALLITADRSVSAREQHVTASKAPVAEARA